MADWSGPESSWRRIDKKLGGLPEEPRGVATCQNYPQRAATVPPARVAKVQKHISDAHYDYRAIYAPISISRQNRDLCKVLHIDSKAERKLEKSAIAEETKQKIMQSIFCV